MIYSKRSSMIRIIAILTLCAALSAVDYIVPLVSNAESSSKAYSTYKASEFQNYWYDGQRKRTIWINPEMVAEFGLRDTTEVGAVRSAYPSAEKVEGITGQVRIWRLPQGEESSTVVTKASVLKPQASLSVVFGAGSPSGPPSRALPGNIVVIFDPDWGSAEIEAWLTKYGLSVVREMRFGVNIYELYSPAGIESLDLANSIHESGTVISASPVWWLNVKPQ